MQPDRTPTAARRHYSAVEVHQARKALVGTRVEYQGEWHSVAHIDHYGVWLVSLEKLDAVPFLSDLEAHHD